MADTLAKALAIESGYCVLQDRKARGWTLEELAQKTARTGSAIGDFEQATRPHWLT
jgi:transcriptional regulator with XRE-family HTH domain